MSCLAIATALFEVVPMLKKMTRHPLKGPDVVKNISAIARHLTKESDPSKITDAFNEDPALLVEFYKELMATEKEMFLATLHDREHARARTTPENSRIMLTIALMGLGTCMMFLSYGAPSLEITTLLSTVCGVFGSCLKDVYAFEFAGKPSSQH